MASCIREHFWRIKKYQVSILVLIFHIYMFGIFVCSNVTPGQKSYVLQHWSTIPVHINMENQYLQKFVSNRLQCPRGERERERERAPRNQPNFCSKKHLYRKPAIVSERPFFCCLSFDYYGLVIGSHSWPSCIPLSSAYSRAQNFLPSNRAHCYTRGFKQFA